MAGDFGTLTQGVFPTILADTHADALTQPFWDAAKEDRLVCQQCTNCGTFRMPPSPFCFNCQKRDYTFTELPGTGKIYSFTVVRHPLHPDLADCCPYVSGVVELDGTQGAGARMLVNIIGVDPETVKIGDAVEIVFEHVNVEMSTPRFRPISS
ncbi:MAG: Zn-ribbon domain-containing OB-fold protein [Acidimicrobiia bacterium]